MSLSIVTLNSINKTNKKQIASNQLYVEKISEFVSLPSSKLLHIFERWNSSNVQNLDHYKLKAIKPPKVLNMGSNSKWSLIMSTHMNTRWSGLWISLVWLTFFNITLCISFMDFFIPYPNYQWEKLQNTPKFFFI